MAFMGKRDCFAIIDANQHFILREATRVLSAR
jgi:hypothetical protein